MRPVLPAGRTAAPAARLGLTSGVVGIVFLAQGGAWSMDVVVAGVQRGLAATVLEILHAMRDRGRDLKAGRAADAARRAARRVVDPGRHGERGRADPRSLPAESRRW
jgi:hypothetical protein